MIIPCKTLQWSDLSVIVKRAAEHHSSLLPIVMSRHHNVRIIAICLVDLPIIFAKPQVGSISWMGRTGLPCASAVNVNLLTTQ